MSTLVLSEAEKAYIVAGVEDGFRTDGRSNEDFRTINIQTGIVSNTNGSAQVKIVRNALYMLPIDFSFCFYFLSYF